MPAINYSSYRLLCGNMRKLLPEFSALLLSAAMASATTHFYIRDFFHCYVTFFFLAAVGRILVRSTGTTYSKRGKTSQREVLLSLEGLLFSECLPDIIVLK